MIELHIYHGIDTALGKTGITEISTIPANTVYNIRNLKDEENINKNL